VRPSLFRLVAEGLASLRLCEIQLWEAANACGLTRMTLWSALQEVFNESHMGVFGALGLRGFV
jgi:hypothetical protein